MLDDNKPSLFEYYAVVSADYEHLYEDTTNNIESFKEPITDIVMSELTNPPYGYELVSDDPRVMFVYKMNKKLKYLYFYIKRSQGFIPSLDIIDILYVTKDEMQSKLTAGYNPVTEYTTGIYINFNLNTSKNECYLTFKRRGNKTVENNIDLKYQNLPYISDIAIHYSKESPCIPFGYDPVTINSSSIDLTSIVDSQPILNHPSMATSKVHLPTFVLSYYIQPEYSSLPLLFSSQITDYLSNNENNKTNICPDLIDTFLFPGGISLKKSVISPLWKPFLIHTSTGHYRYGVSFILYQHINKDDQQLLSQLYPKETEGFELNSFYSPIGIVLISEYPYIQEMKMILTQLYSIYIHPSQSIPLLCYIYQLIYNVPAPTIGNSVLIKWSQTNIIEFIRPYSRGLPYSNISLSPLLLTLSSSIIIHIINAILLEQKIIIFSSSSNILFYIFASLSRLLFPFVPACAVIPLCPPSLLLAIDVPGTCIIGVRKCDMIHCIISKDILVVDVDNNILYNDNSLLLPKEIINMLTEIIQQSQYKLKDLLSNKKNQLLYTSWMDSFSFLLPPTNPPELSELQIIDIYRVLLDSFCLLVGSYKLFLHKDISTNSTSIKCLEDIFDSKDYINHLSKDYSIFMKKFIHTQIFVNFLSQRLFPPNGTYDFSLLFFDKYQSMILLPHEDRVSYIYNILYKSNKEVISEFTEVSTKEQKQNINNNSICIKLPNQNCNVYCIHTPGRWPLFSQNSKWNNIPLSSILQNRYNSIYNSDEQYDLNVLNKGQYRYIVIITYLMNIYLLFSVCSLYNLTSINEKEDRIKHIHSFYKNIISIPLQLYKLSLYSVFVSLCLSTNKTMYSSTMYTLYIQLFPSKMSKLDLLNHMNIHRDTLLIKYKEKCIEKENKFNINHNPKTNWKYSFFKKDNTYNNTNNHIKSIDNNILTKHNKSKDASDSKAIHFLSYDSIKCSYEKINDSSEPTNLYIYSFCRNCYRYLLDEEILTCEYINHGHILYKCSNCGYDITPIFICDYPNVIERDPFMRNQYPKSKKMILLSLQTIYKQMEKPFKKDIFEYIDIHDWIENYSNLWWMYVWYAYRFNAAIPISNDYYNKHVHLSTIFSALLIHSIHIQTNSFSYSLSCDDYSISIDTSKSYDHNESKESINNELKDSFNELTAQESSMNSMKLNNSIQKTVGDSNNVVNKDHPYKWKYIIKDKNNIYKIRYSLNENEYKEKYILTKDIELFINFSLSFILSKNVKTCQIDSTIISILIEISMLIWKNKVKDAIELYLYSRKHNYHPCFKNSMYITLLFLTYLHSTIPNAHNTISQEEISQMKSTIYNKDLQEKHRIHKSTQTKEQINSTKVMSKNDSESISMNINHNIDETRNQNIMTTQDCLDQFEMNYIHCCNDISPYYKSSFQPCDISISSESNYIRKRIDLLF